MTDIKTTLHGSMRKNYSEFKQIKELFDKAGINVIAPRISEVLSLGNNGFTYSEGDDLSQSSIEIEADFLAKAASLDPSRDFAYIINPGGYIGKSCSAELTFLLSQQKRIFAMEEIQDPPLLLPDNYIYSPQNLIEIIKKTGYYPMPQHLNNQTLDVFKKMISPLVAVGGIIIDESSKEYAFDKRIEKNICLIKKPERGNQYTIIGGTKLVNETDYIRVKKELEEQLGISEFAIENIIISFLEITNSGYRNNAIFREFKDYTIRINNLPKNQNLVCLPPTIAINELPLEPNARKTIEKYISLL